MRSRRDFLSPIHRSLIFALAAFVSLALVCTAAASTITWINASGGNWSNASNWSPAVVPNAAGQTAVLPALSGPYQVTLDVSPGVDAIQIDGGGPTLDLAGYSISAVPSVSNGGVIQRMHGLYDSSKLHNNAGGTIEVAAGDSITTVGDALVNDGTIEIPTLAVMDLANAGGVEVRGTGTVFLKGGRISSPMGYPDGPIGYGLGIQYQQTVKGGGDIWVSVSNGGLLNGSDTQRMIEIIGGVTNVGTIRVDQGGSINVKWSFVRNAGTIVGSGGTFTVRPWFNYGTINNVGGRIMADGNDLNLTCGTLWAGTIEQSGGSGRVRVGYCTAQDLVVTAGAELSADGLVDVTADGNGLLNNGTIYVPGRINYGLGTIYFNGTGRVVLEGGILDTPGSTGTMVNSSGHTITGCGTIDARLTNYGTVDFDCSSGPSALRTNPKTNYGVMRLSRGTLHLQGSATRVANAGSGTFGITGGELWIDKGGTLDLGGKTLVAPGTVLLGTARSASSIVNGTLEATGAGRYLNYGSATLRDVTLGSSAVFDTWGGATTTATGASLTNRGLNRVDIGGTFTVASTTDYVQTAGTTELQGGRLTATRELQFQGGAIRGAGTIVGDVLNAAEIGAGTPIGGLTIQGNYHQLPTGQLSIDLAGSGPADFNRLAVTGTTRLDGKLSVSTVNGYKVPGGCMIDVLSWGTLDGAFAQYVGSDGGAPLPLEPRYGDASLVMVVNPEMLGAGDPVAPKTLRFFGARTAGGAAFALDLPRASEVTVRAFDVSGREVAVLASGARPAGRHTFALAGAHGALPGGVYFARAVVRSNGATETRAARVVAFH